MMHGTINIKYKTVFLSPVLHGCETWSHTLKDHCGLKMSGKRVQGRIFWH